MIQEDIDLLRKWQSGTLTFSEANEVAIHSGKGSFTCFLVENNQWYLGDENYEWTPWVVNGAEIPREHIFPRLIAKEASIKTLEKAKLDGLYDCKSFDGLILPTLMDVVIHKFQYWQLPFFLQSCIEECDYPSEQWLSTRIDHCLKQTDKNVSFEENNPLKTAALLMCCTGVHSEEQREYVIKILSEQENMQMKTCLESLFLEDSQTNQRDFAVKKSRIGL